MALRNLELRALFYNSRDPFWSKKSTAEKFRGNIFCTNVLILIVIQWSSIIFAIKVTFSGLLTFSKVRRLLEGSVDVGIQDNIYTHSISPEHEQQRIRKISFTINLWYEPDL